MKYKTLLIICLLSSAFCLFSGCQPGNIRKDQNIDYSKIAGTWKAEKAFWQVVITEDGKVESAIIQFADAPVKPNATTHIEMKDGSISSFKSGKFTLVYDPLKSVLEVNLDIEKIDIKFLDNEIKGKNYIIIGGTISDDGKTWDADVIERFDYGPRFPQDEEDVYPEPIKFHKISN